MAKGSTQTHSAKYDTVQTFYSLGAWSIERVRNSVVKGWITEAEFKEITGEDY